VTLAEASAEAIKRVPQAIGTEEAPMRYMLGEKYIRRSATSPARTTPRPC
jgi:hypothetical protein